VKKPRKPRQAANGKSRPEYRRLNAGELKAQGFGPKSKRRVKASVGKITSKTKIYTDRELHTKAIRARKLAAAETPKQRREARRATKESFSKSRIEVRPLKSGGQAIEFKHLGRPELFKKLRKYQRHEIMMKFEGVKANSGGDSGRPRDREQWFSAYDRIEAGELLDPDNFDDWLETNGADEADEFGLIVYPLRA
jgi:hypothetical protein